MINERDVSRFVRESNLIEGIVRDPVPAEIAATLEFLEKPALALKDLVELVKVYAPGHVIRDKSTLNVRVGAYVAPLGGPELVKKLQNLLIDVNTQHLSPWHAHVEYEMLHPFTDGNGRSGRALWAWHTVALGQDPFSISFLHRFYYQTLSNQRS